MLGSHCIKTWSASQGAYALSSAEAEFYAMAERAARSIGMKSMLGELGIELNACCLCTDSSAAKSFASRRGLGKMRHIDVKHLWLQDLVKQGEIRLAKVLGDRNPADLLTKYHDRARVKMLGRIGGIDITLTADAEGECRHKHPDLELLCDT